MSKTLTIDDIWKLFQETNRLFQESELKAQAAQARLEHDLQETRRMLQEANAQAQAQAQARLEEANAQAQARLEEANAQAQARL
ncbi:MAG: DUF3782 domain-containing protein, partial [Magnetococcales bacterium]|nr:DUF3782 domain-containing protein [Magnetococcales bacterium]